MGLLSTAKMATRGRHGTNGETWGRPASSLWVTPASAQVPVHYRSAAAVLGFAGCAGENANEGHQGRDARLRRGLAQLPFRQAHDRRGHRRLERVRRGLRLARRRHRDRAPGPARGRAGGRRARAHLRRALQRHPAGLRRRRRPGASAPSRTRCSTPRPRRSACPATSCSAARCATASASTGRTARPGASITRATTSRRSPTSTASRRSAARCARRSFTALKTNIFIYEAAARPQGLAPGLRRAVLSRAQRRPERAAQSAHAPGSASARAPGRTSTCCSTSTSTPRPKAISRSCAPSPTSTCSGSRSTPSAQRRWATSAAHSPHPISSCETLLGLREFLPYFREQAMDVAIIDTPWNGVWQSMKIAAAAEAHEVNVAPHNFYGHLCTMMNAHFAAAVPNLRIMETDIDRLAWDDELFTHRAGVSRTAIWWCPTGRAGADPQRGRHPSPSAEGRPPRPARLRPEEIGRTPPAHPGGRCPQSCPGARRRG